VPIVIGARWWVCARLTGHKIGEVFGGVCLVPLLQSVVATSVSGSVSILEVVVVGEKILEA